MTDKIKLINLHLCFDRKKFGNKNPDLIWICNLTGIQNIHLRLCFDMKIQTKGFEFVFWLDRSILSTFKGDLKYFFFQIKFPFWQDKSRKLTLILCFDRLTKWIYLLWQEKFSKFIWILVFTIKRQLGQRQNLKLYLKLKIHLKGVFSKPSGNCIVSPNLCFFS